MRKLVLATILLSTTLNAQSTFAPIGAKWTYKQGTAFSPDTNLAVLEVINDTLIQGRTCSKLQINQGWFGCHEFVQFFSQSNDSMFYFDPTSNEFHLLFRWNAVVGENWSTPVEQSGFLDTLDWSVIDTGQTTIDGLWLRTLQINVVPRQGTIYGYGGTVIERLGGLWTPFTWILGFCDGETFLELRCYEDPDISWLNPQFPQCDLSVGLEEALRGTSLEIRPTWASTNEPIQLIARSGTIMVLDATGRVVLKRPVQGQGSFDLDTPGTYVVRLTTSEGESAHQRIVVR